MDAPQLAQEYLRILFSGENLDGLYSVLADDLVFRGPWFQFDTAEDYIVSLKESPFVDARYEVIQAVGDESSASVLYQFSKPGVSTPMALSVRANGGKLTEILLVFDTRAFGGA